MKIWIIILVLTAIMISGCTEQPTEVNLSNNITNSDLDYIFLDGEGEIPLELCSERTIDDKIILLVSKYCGACKIVIPRLEEVEKELQIEIIYLDSSKNEDLEKIKELKIIPRYTPTLLIGCDVYIGAYPKEKYKELIKNFIDFR